MESRAPLGHLWAVAAALAATVAGRLVSPPLDVVNVAMIYLLGVVVVSMREARGPAIFAAVLAVVAFDVMFVPPVGRLTVEDLQYVVTFAIMVIVALVITALRERSRREGAARERLAVETEGERIRAMLLASVSHDLRTPLAVLSGAASSLATQWERLGDAERSELAASVEREATRLAGHVDKVLQMTRLETSPRVSLDWASIPEIGAAVLQRLEQTLAAHRVVVELPGDLPLARIDEGLIDVALGNLLENAALHTPAGTVVRLQARATERELEISVEDYGGGVPEPELERVFAKFHRPALEAGGGMGLGLAITRSIVTLHGGRCWAERVPAGGMAFRFTLPRAAPPAMPAEEGPR